jgi:hypothetical protein
VATKDSSTVLKKKYSSPPVQDDGGRRLAGGGREKETLQRDADYPLLHHQEPQHHDSEDQPLLLLHRPLLGPPAVQYIIVNNWRIIKQYRSNSLIKGTLTREKCFKKAYGEMPSAFNMNRYHI